MVLDEEPRLLAEIRWGLIPSWAKDAKIGASLINARSEAVTTKPPFRAACKKRRCLIPADGFGARDLRAAAAELLQRVATCRAGIALALARGC